MYKRESEDRVGGGERERREGVRGRERLRLSVRGRGEIKGGGG
jgi:hypothetical protein